METPKKLPEGYLQNSQGHLVPVEKVKPIDITRNDLVQEIIVQAIQLQQVLKAFKKKTMEDITAFVELSAEKYDAKLGGNKGNVTLFSFNGEYKVVRQVAEHINFDERLQAARQLIEECMLEWSEGINANVRALINHAFKVDKAGNLSTSRILGLRQLDITDEKWIKAMAAIGDSITVIGSKSYVRMYKRIGTDEQWEAISLDVASL